MGNKDLHLRRSDELNLSHLIAFLVCRTCQSNPIQSFCFSSLQGQNEALAPPPSEPRESKRDHKTSLTVTRLLFI